MASKPAVSRDVFVGSLPDEADEESITQIFSIIGDVQSVTIKEGKNNMSNFCFVRFFNEDHVETAINELNGHVYKGKALSVKPAGRKSNKMEGGGAARQSDQRNFQGQRRPPLPGYGNRPWGDGGYDDYRQWREESIAMTHVVDATTFFAQICNLETANAYQAMITQLFEHCSYAHPLVTEIQPNQVYGAVFSMDSGWYRCTVKGTDSATGKVTVWFVDYGNEETVDGVVELPPALANVPYFAYRMTLYGLESSFANKSSENAKKALEYLSTLSEADKLKVRVSNQMPSPELSVVLFNDGQNVNELIQTNFADKRPSPVMSPVQQQQQQQPQDGSGHYAQSRQTQHQRNWGAPSPPGVGDNSAALVAQLQNERANLIQKVHEMKMEVQVLQSSKETEVNSYKEKVDFAMDYKIATILGSLRRVKKARSLFPTSDNQKAPLENAIDVIHGGEVTLNGEKKTFRDATPRSQSVEEKLELLSNCQSLIRSCTNKEELSQLVENRNDARQHAFQAMKEFLEVSEQLPIDDRLTTLENVLNTIHNGYPSMLQPVATSEGSPEEIYEEYKAWLDLKMKKLKSYWRETEESLANWERLVSEMKLAFSFSSDSEFEAKNLDASIQQLLVAMETELVISCQGYEPHIPLNPDILKQRQAELQLENEVLTKTVQAVLCDIQEEATFLDNLSTHCKKYQRKKEDLQEWLEGNTPNVEELQTLQKKIKVARSKLRHLLVDLRDGEEDPDLLGDKTLEELKGDIANYQEQLLGYYTKEDELLSHLSKLTNEHFPELVMTHSSLGLQKYLETDGLVKDGRDLMHFNLSPVPSCQKTTTKLASISSKNVAVIKSHHLPDVTSQKKFLERVQMYKSISCPFLVPVYGIIPDNDSNQYHLQLWYHALGNFNDVMQSESPPSESQILTYLKNILLALQALHNVQFVHGAIHPNNILFKSPEEVLLADYDFSKAEVEKGKQAYKSNNGLCFQAPDIALGIPASTAMDIFSFGILVLWSHYPTSPFQLNQNGVPDLDGLPIPRDLLNFVAPMLNINPSNRPTVKHILDFGYLDRLASTLEDADPKAAQSLNEDNVEEGSKEENQSTGGEEEKEEEEQEGKEQEEKTEENAEEISEETEAIVSIEAVTGIDENKQEETHKDEEIANDKDPDHTEEDEQKEVEGKENVEETKQDEDVGEGEEDGNGDDDSADGSNVDKIYPLTNGKVQPEKNEENEEGVISSPPPLVDE